MKERFLNILENLAEGYLLSMLAIIVIAAIAALIRAVLVGPWWISIIIGLFVLCFASMVFIDIRNVNRKKADFMEYIKKINKESEKDG